MNWAILLIPIVLTAAVFKMPRVKFLYHASLKDPAEPISVENPA